MKLKLNLQKKGSADGFYCLQAPGCTVARLSWADEDGVLEDWTSFSYIPLDAFGKGSFRFQGGRAIPPEATHIHVRAVKNDLIEWDEALFEIPEVYRAEVAKKGTHFCVMSDLHISSKAGAILRAFSQGKSAEAILIAGDMTNDGFIEQYKILEQCLMKELPETTVFSVIGNHDMLLEESEEHKWDEVFNYEKFQDWLLCKKNKIDVQHSIHYGPGNAYAVRMGRMDIIGLQAISLERQFLFEDGVQLDWLNRYLTANQDVDWHLILCHAPLLRHNPKREVGINNPYLNRDKELQQIIDRHGNVVFISGHTHLSMDNLMGCVEWNEEYQNLYINVGSIRPTSMLPDEMLQPAEWTEGTFSDLFVDESEIEIVTRSVRSGKKHARGYYRIQKNG